MRPRKHFRIYKSRWHILLTILFLVVPFIFLILFAEFAKIALSTLVTEIFYSVSRLAIAYFIAVFFGWLFAVLFYKGKLATIALPVFDVLQSFPTFAALPLAVFVWGRSEFTVIFFLIITVIWPIFFSTISSLRSIKQEWEEVADLAELTPLQYIQHYLWPISVPGLVTGSVIGLGEGWEALVATEIIVQTKVGLGDFFQHSASSIPLTLFGILGFLMLIFLINKIIWLPLLEWSHMQMEE